MIKITDQLHVEMEEILIEDYPAQRINMASQLMTQNAAQTAASTNKVPKFDTIPEKAPMRIQNLIELYCKIEEMSE